MSILQNETQYGILAWIGPGREQITPQTMADLKRAGFNLSLSQVTPEPDRMKQELDLAAEAGVRLIIGYPDLRVQPGTVTDEWKKTMAGVVEIARDHPGVYGYYIADEPRKPLFDDIAKAFAFFREHDPDHLCYYNHWTVNQGFCGFRSYEDMWDTFGELCDPDFVSSDLYPYKPVREDEWLANKETSPYYFNRTRAHMAEHYYEMLEIVRQYAKRWNVPMWMCNRARSLVCQPPHDGEVRCEAMMNLAYGAKCIQYFTYAHGYWLIDRDLQPNERWEVVRKVNRTVQAWGPTLMKLKSIGVYHYPADLAYTRPLDKFVLGNSSDLVARGDAVVVGHFVDEDDWEYALIVNRNPFEASHTSFGFGTDQVEECDPETGTFGDGWPRVKTPKADLYFTPGQGRLFRFRRSIETKA